MSDDRESVPGVTVTAQVDPQATTEVVPQALGSLDDIDKIDFLLEEIENKIAPLALA